MVDKYTTSKDGKLWTFTLRPSLKFSDGTAVTAADVVASMQRWTSQGQHRPRHDRDLAGRSGRRSTTSTFTLTLKEPFGMVLDGMAKPSGFPPVVMPERMAKMPTTAPLTEVMGSGPFMFKRDEWVPGNKAVFVRNPHYVGAQRRRRTAPPAARSRTSTGSSGSTSPMPTAPSRRSRRARST